MEWHNGTNRGPSMDQNLEAVKKAIGEMYNRASAEMIQPEHVRQIDAESHQGAVIHPRLNMGKVVIVDLHTQVTGCAG